MWKLFSTLLVCLCFISTNSNRAVSLNDDSSLMNQTLGHRPTGRPIPPGTINRGPPGAINRADCIWLSNINRAVFGLQLIGGQGLGHITYVKVQFSGQNFSQNVFKLNILNHFLGKSTTLIAKMLAVFLSNQPVKRYKIPLNCTYFCFDGLNLVTTIFSRDFVRNLCVSDAIILFIIQRTKLP